MVKTSPSQTNAPRCGWRKVTPPTAEGCSGFLALRLNACDTQKLEFVLSPQHRLHLTVHFFLQQAREHLTAGSAKDNDWSLFMFNGEKIQNLKLTETSEAFSEELEEESEFHSTLYHMLKASASSEAMDKVERAGFLFIDSVYQLLLATRVLAYS